MVEPEALSQHIAAINALPVVVVIEPVATVVELEDPPPLPCTPE
jgi:hypothetical protein